MEHFEAEQKLRDIFFDPVEGFTSPQRLYKKARENGIDVTMAQVKCWLDSQIEQKRFSPARHNFKRVKTFAPSAGYQLQVNLVDMSKYEKENESYRWILTGSDVFSRAFFAIPLLRKHKDFTVNAFRLLLEKFEDRFGYEPTLVQFDQGGEFVNTKVLSLFDEKGIRHFSTRLTSKKASIVKRANKNLKTKMWLYFSSQGNRRWIDVLPKLVQNINQSVNRPIGLKPDEVDEWNEPLVFVKLYGQPSSSKRPSFKVGDEVLLSKYAKPFKRSEQKDV